MSAAIDVYTDALLTGNITPITTATSLDAAQGVVTKKLSNSFNNDGSIIRVAYAQWCKGTESDGTIYRFFRQLPGNLIPLSIRIAGAALAGCTSVKVGLLRSGQVIPGGPIGGGVFAAGSDAVFATGLDIHLGAINFNQATAFDGMGVVNASYTNIQKRLFEYAGETILTRQNIFDMAMTLTTGGTATGLIGVKMEYIIG